MCVSILIYMYKKSINLKITLLDYPALILQRWWACLKHRKPITWPLSSWCLWESAPWATKEGQSGNKLREAEKVQSAIKCVWTGFPCAFTMFRMLRDNFLKVHFKLNLHFFPIKKKKKTSVCLPTSLTAEKPEGHVVWLLKMIPNHRAWKGGAGSSIGLASSNAL